MGDNNTQDFREPSEADAPRSWGELIDQASLSSAGINIGTHELLGLLGYVRRGVNVNAHVREELSDSGLQMRPELEEADYYGNVRVFPAVPSGDAGAANTDTPPFPAALDARGGSLSEWIVSSLKEDGDPLDFLVYGDTIETAREKMHTQGRSKLPLFFSRDDMSSLIGTVTQADLTANGDNSAKLIELAQTHVHVVPTNDKLFDWIPLILQQGMVYGKDPSGNVVQIYTTKDVALRLNMLAQMFLRVNELEDLIRGFLTEIDADEVASAKQRWGSLTKVPLDLAETEFLSEEEVKSPGAGDDHPAENFMFADYQKCLGDTVFWNEHIAPTAVGATLDKAQCIRTINDARIARNAVMHCSSQEDLERLAPSLEALAVWLRKVAHSSAI